MRAPKPVLSLSYGRGCACKCKMRRTDLMVRKAANRAPNRAPRKHQHKQSPCGRQGGADRGVRANPDQGGTVFSGWHYAQHLSPRCTFHPLHPLHPLHPFYLFHLLLTQSHGLNIFMGLSTEQRKILELVSAGYRMVVVKSPLTEQAVYVALVDPKSGRSERDIPLWRARRLLAAGVVQADSACLETATELQIVPPAVKPPRE